MTRIARAKMRFENMVMFIFYAVHCFVFYPLRHERRREKLAKEAAVERTSRWRSGDGDAGEEAEECDRKKSPAKKASEKVGDFFGKINTRHSENSQEEEATGAYVEMKDSRKSKHEVV